MTKYFQNNGKYRLDATLALENCVYALYPVYMKQPIPVAARSKSWVSCRSLPVIVGSNPYEDIDVSLLWLLYVVR